MTHQSDYPTPITRDEFSVRIVELCLKSGLTGFLRKSRDQQILMKSVALTLNVVEEYTEKEMDEKLSAWLRDTGRSISFDHVNLRRLLVDKEHIGRSRDGSRYWLAAFSRNQPLFEPEVDEIDVHGLIRAGREEIAQRKQEYMQRRQISRAV